MRSMVKGWSKQEWSWAFYDWANSAYVLIVMTAFFPLFLGQHAEAAQSEISKTTLLGYANAIGSILVVFLAPALGALADQYGAKKRFLAMFAFVGVAATFSLGLIENGQPFFAAAVFVAGNLGFSGANGFYDALLLSVTSKDKYEKLSALGYALGYAGSLLLFALGFFVAMRPQAFGLADSFIAMRVIFMVTALWWLVFTIPLMKAVQKEDRLAGEGVRPWQAMRGAFAELRKTAEELKQYRGAAVFLLAYWFYIDGVHTVIKMAVTYSEALKFDSKIPLIGILVVQLIGIPATLAFGWLAGKVGVKKMIMIGVGAYLLVTAGAPLMTRPAHFFILAGVIGLAQGGVQSMSRSMFARLIPEHQVGKYFGFYNMVGKFAAVVGPFLMASLALFFDERWSILAIPLLLIVGLWLLSRVKEPAGPGSSEILAGQGL